MPPPASSPLDPMAMWRDLVAQWEKGTNDFAGQAMLSDPFRQGMHGGMNASLQVQKALGELMARFLGSLNLPSRDDVQALGDQLQRIDDHLGRIAQALEARDGATRPPGAAGAVARPPRTRQPQRPPVPPPAVAAPAGKKPRGRKA